MGIDINEKQMKDSKLRREFGRGKGIKFIEYYSKIKETINKRNKKYQDDNPNPIKYDIDDKVLTKKMTIIMYYRQNR